MRFLFTAILLFATSAHSQGADYTMNPADYCGNGVAKVQVSLYPGHEGSPKFTLSYKYFGNGNPSSTTVIVLPGGPGDTLLNPAVHSPTEAFPYGAVPTSLNIIYTEPRGLGCNQLAQGDFPFDAFKTSYIASDILEIIKDRKLDNYILYGASFGTVVATYVASQADAAGVPAPKAVVLEGTFGRGVPGKFDEYIGGFSQEWEKTKLQLSPQLAAAFTKDPLPLGFAANVWGSYIFWQLITYGPGMIKYSPLVHANETPPNPALKSALTTYAVLAQLPVSERITRIFQTIGCQELFGAWKPDVILKDGKLFGSGEDICTGFTYLPYDSAKLNITSPIFYFQGPDDPATPLTSARYHFENQIHTNRALNTVGSASHASLSLVLRSLGCSDNVWAQIASNPSQMNLDFSSCKGWPISTAVKTAQ